MEKHKEEVGRVAERAWEVYQKLVAQLSDKEAKLDREFMKPTEKEDLSLITSLQGDIEKLEKSLGELEDVLFEAFEREEKLRQQIETTEGFLEDLEK